MFVSTVKSKSAQMRIIASKIVYKWQNQVWQEGPLLNSS